MKDFSKEILAYALENAIEFGKTDVSRVLPKLFQHGLEKGEIKKVIKEIENAVKKVNSMKRDEMAEMFGKVKDFIIAREEKEKELGELENVSKKMIFRMAPYPSGALHIGNAKTYLINALYAEKYNAKLLLIMDDTIGSEEKQLIAEAYKLIEDSLKWLNVKYAKPVIYKSDRLRTYYKYAVELIRKDKAYVCHCSQEELGKNRAAGVECGHRKLPVKIQLERWKQMFEDEKGAAVLRIKTDMQHKNPAFRDRVLFKISDRKHPRVGNKYRVWPTLEMSWAIDDHLLGITHIIRGNDLTIESDMEKYIWNIFGWKHPELIHTGLVKIEGIKISKSKAQKEVKSGEFLGWDDPRTWSIQSLERRGIKKEAVRKFVKEIGASKHDITIPIDVLYSINRKLIDASSFRYSFVEAPVELEFVNPNRSKIKEIKIPVHPDRKETRNIKLYSNKIFISKKDFNKFKGSEVRLLHLYNVNLSESGKSEITTIENKEIPKINWVSNGVKARVLMPEGYWINGIAEEAVKKLKKGEVIQFERNFFCRFDGLNNGIYEFWFGHK